MVELLKNEVEGLAPGCTADEDCGTVADVVSEADEDCVEEELVANRLELEGVAEVCKVDVGAANDADI